MSENQSAAKHAIDVDNCIARADTHFRNDRMPEALAAYREAIVLCPENVHALHHAGLACFHNCQLEHARVFINRALTLAPRRADIWEHGGLLAALGEDYVAAEAFYCHALSLSGGTASLHRNLGDCLRLSGRLGEAIIQYENALEIEPQLHHAIRALAKISAELGDISHAVDYWKRAWAIHSGELADGLDLIVVLAKAERHADVGDVVDHMRSHFSADAIALKELSYALNSIHHFSEAISVAEKGLGVDPNNAWLHHNAAYAFTVLGDLSRMRAHCAEAARLLPDDAHMQYNLALSHLQSGDFRSGWKGQKWHEYLPCNHDLVRPDFPEWAGEPVLGRKFLLIGEQGVGDQIQFLRMADWLHRRGAVVDVWVSEALGDLARGASGVHAVWVDQPHGVHDFWCRMLRVPEHIKLDLPMLPIAMPYLTPTEARVQHWQRYLDKISPVEMPRRMRVGLVWAGNPEYHFDRYRSIELNALRPLLRHAGVVWFSLQKGAAEREGEALAGTLAFHTLGPAIADFSDTLAIIQTLDLVITVDTSVAHLAGAAGRPVWVLLSTCTDWRWLVDRPDSPWYPSMRLFRQQQLGDWGPVVEEVLSALDESRCLRDKDASLGHLV